jgi:hypothetical protein
MPMTPEEIDLAELARVLHEGLGHDPPLGYLRGKALMRDVLVEERGFSALEAEELVDTLESNGFVHFLGDPSHRSVADAPWEIRPRQVQVQAEEPSIEIKPAEAGQVVEISDEEG